MTVNGTNREFGTWVSLVGERQTEILDRFDGVGLVRGEFFMRRAMRSVLHEDVQAFIGSYLDSLCTAMNGREVWYRTADLWSDEADVLDGTKHVILERNPIVGVRGLRRSLAVPDEFMTECQVLGKVCARHDNLGVLFPFVADEDEFSCALGMAREAGVSARVGAMVEIPSAVLRAAEIVDAGASLLLVGMNDLSCLTVGRERSAGFSDKLHPAVVRLVATAVVAAHARSVRCGVAGSLSPAVVAMAERCGADFATVHYSQARKLLWPDDGTWSDDDAWPDEGLELEIKRRTKDAIRALTRALVRLDDPNTEGGSGRVDD